MPFSKVYIYFLNSLIMVKIGIIGGSGLDDPDILKEVKEIEVDTPYGKPSSNLKIGKIGEKEVVLLARHGRKHEIPPTQVNYRANIWALKEQGCTHIIATSAVGSLKEEIGRGDFVVLDQFIDFTKHRKFSFFEDFNGGPRHVSLAEPFNKEIRKSLINGCKELNLKTHEKGTVVTIEGPRFSTKAESYMFRRWGADVINMSIAPEAILAMEVGIPYAVVAMSTDYDCWRESEKPVTWEEILKVFNENSEKIKNLLLNVIPQVGEIDLKGKIRTVPHWPKQGIMFRDITTLLKDPEGFNYVVEQFVNRYKNRKIDVVVGIESRGFILGGVVAKELGVGFVPLRKPGKLPAETEKVEYELEYGKDALEIHKDAISLGQNVLLIDDLLATGGTAKAAVELIEKLGGKIEEIAFIIDLPDLKGSEKLQGYNIFKMVDFEGD